MLRAKYSVMRCTVALGDLNRLGLGTVLLSLFRWHRADMDSSVCIATDHGLNGPRI